MSDNPMYWSSHQRPAWHQQPAPSAQPVSSMGHYAHPGSMLGNPMTPGMPGDPSLLIQSSIPGRQPHQSTLSHHQSNPLAPSGAPSTLYSSMAAQGSARQGPQMAPNSHLTTAPNQGLAPHGAMQQPPHPQSHYPHQYSSYWNPPPINSQPSLGPSGASGNASSATLNNAGPPSQQTDAASSYHPANASSLNMPADSRSGMGNNTASLQPSAASFHSPKDIQTPDHVMPYDRQRVQMTQQQNPQHPTAMMSQNVPPSSTANSNLSPTQGQMSMQGRLQSQNPMDPMRSMSQQSGAAPGWSTSGYYGQTSQSPYSSVMNPYMPYGNSSVPNSSVVQPPTRPTMGQKPPTNGSARGPAPSYPPHGSTMYGQPPPPTGGTNGSYYGYDAYYSQTPSDLYLSHPNPSGASQHWPSSAPTNQMMSNSSASSSQIQPSLRPPGSSSANVHPQSPSASSLPTMSSRTPAPSQTPDRSPAPSTSYPSPNQGSSAKSSSNSLAQLEQMVMPNSGQSVAPSVKSPSQQSSSPSSSSLQPQMQYSYNSSGQGSYFTSSSGSAPSQAGYYPQYDSSGPEIQKPNWSEPGSHLASVGPSAGSHMIEGSQNSYNQLGFEANSPYGEFTQLSAPGPSSVQSRFASSGEGVEPQPTDKSDPYAIDSQTFDDFDDQSSVSKGKKTRAKKGEDKVKRERKPRAPRAPKASNVAPKSPLGAASSQIIPPRSSTQTPDASSSQASFPSPSRQNSMKPIPETIEQPVLPRTPNTAAPTSPTHRLSTDSPSAPIVQPQQYSYQPSGQPNYFNDAPSNNQSNYYTSYESGSDASKSWPDRPEHTSNIQLTSVPAVDNHATFSQNKVENSANYSSEYTSLSGPAISGSDIRPPSVANEVPENAKTEVNEDQTVAPQAADVSPETLVTKTKKSRTKKGDEKPKKEKSSRTGKNSKASTSAPISSSPLPTTPVPSNSVQDSTSTSSLHLATPHYSPDGVQIDSHGVRNTVSPAKSPSLSRTPSESVGSKTPPHRPYTYGAQVKQDYYSGHGTAPSYYPQYDPSIPAMHTLPLGPVDGCSAPYAQPSSYPEYTTLSTPSGASQLPTNELERVDKPPDEQEASAEQIPPTKVKKVRVRKTDEKTKKERKPRAAKTPQLTPAIEQPTLSPQHNEETIERSLDQTSQEPTNETPKPKRVRVRDSSSKGKKKLPKFALKFAKTKKRKRLGSSDNEQSDLEKTPPPSPDEVESGVQKRRSARNTKKLKYNDDIELGFSESDDDTPSKSKKHSVPDGENTTQDDSAITDEPTVFAAPVEDTMVVEKIMSSRMGKRELEPEPGEVLPPDATMIDVEEFYVKYKNLSYLHCDWRTLEELEKGDRRVAQKLKRYKQKKDSSNMFSFMDEEPFDLQYCEVDRILAVNEVEEMIPDEDEEGKSVEPVEPNADSKCNEKPIDFAVENAAAKNPEQVADTNAKADPETKTEVIEAKEPVTEVDTADSASNVEVAEVAATAPLDKVAEESQEKPTTEATEESNQPAEKSAEPTLIVEKEKKMKKKVSRHYLVKWRGLSYEESTWELEEHLDPMKIKQFERFKDPPPKSKWRPVKRPKPEDWVRKEASPVYKNNNTLREYQLEGINWLSFCWHQGRNCILADEMGLGKTIQSIAFVNEIFQHGINGPFLIIVPLSTVGNWAREFETWTDLNVITYHGSSTSREMLKEYEMYYRNEQGNRITNCYKFQVMITTFEIILSDCLELREIPWRCCIIDEAHRLKNRNCKLLEGLRLLNMEHRVLLTGTPLQNNVEELFSLLNFLEPTQFSSTEQFLQEFGDLKTEAQVDKLKLILKPMMLRRLKEDVEKTLAPKEETIVEVELTNIQKKYYRAILEKNFSFLSKGASHNNMPNLMNTMMELRKCCIHPYLINGAEEQILYEAKQMKLAGGEAMSSHQAMVNASGKLVLIDKLLPRLRADGHRVLIFSQMVRCLDILEDYVTHKHYPYERIDGRVRGCDRQQAIDRFSKPGSDRFVFLLCTRAGGLGINLTAADTVIIFDSDWNPQNDLQAQARCHRIGQSKAVKIYRLICRNTYEREMFDKASLKLGLDKAVLQSMNTQKAAGGIDGQLTKKEIEELLRKGAYGALMDDDNAGDKFCEEDIDQILSRRTQVITIDNSEAKGSTFSKATFSSSNNREDIELDDPNFWEKWAKKANIEDDLMSGNDLIQLAPRRRTQTKRYGADGSLLDISEMESSEEDEETISMRTRGGRVRQSKLTPSSASKRGSKRHRMFDDDDDDEYSANIDGGLWSKSDCLKLEKGLLTYGWGQWDKILSTNTFKKDLSVEDCETICRVILLYCLNSYKGDEKIRSFAWELISPPEESTRPFSDIDSGNSGRGRKPKSAPVVAKKSITEEIADAKWPKEARNDPLIALPDDQYRRHLQRNSNRLLIRVKFLHYLKHEILKDYQDKILADCDISEIDLLPVPIDGELPAPWWDEEADRSLLVGIFKHGHDKFNSMRQDPNLCFLRRCGPPNKEDLMAEMALIERNDDLDDENRDGQMDLSGKLKMLEDNYPRDPEASDLLENLVSTVSKEVQNPKDVIVDENKNSIMKTANVAPAPLSLANGSNHDSSKHETNGVEPVEGNPSTEIPNGGEESYFLPFPTANELNQRFRKLMTAYQRNSKKLEIQMAQRARDELKRERTSKFEAAKNEREERKRFLAQKWSRREEADFFRAISSFGVEYDPVDKKHDWNRFRSIGKLEKKLDETLEEYYKAFVVMCKKVTSRPLTIEEEKCPINVDPVTEERASRCLMRIELLNKIREQVITHPELDERLKLCVSQSDLPDWWENGRHDKDLLIAAAKHGLTRLDYNLAHDPALSFSELIKQKVQQFFSQPPTPILIPVEQLQELLDINGIEYIKDMDQQSDCDDVKAVLNSMIDNIDAEDLGEGDQKTGEDGAINSSSVQVNTQSRSSRLLSGQNVTPPRSLPNILTRRGPNTIVKSVEGAGPNPSSVRLEHTTRFDDRGVIEIKPLIPDNLPEEPLKTFEAGEISITINSESALLQMDGRAPIILFGASNPVTAKIRWPKDKAIQTRLENLVQLVEKNEWPSPPKPPVPVITLPNHLTTSLSSSSLPITTSPSKIDKLDMSMGSPKSDSSNMSSRASRQDLRESMNDLPSARGRRGRGRRPKHSDLDDPQLQHQDIDLPREDRQAAAKLRNLLSQHPKSTRASSGVMGDKLTAKFGGNKQGTGLSSLLASFKEKRSDANSSRNRDEKETIDFSAPDLLPNLFNLKPELREAATSFLLNMNSNVGANLKSASNAQLTLESLLNVARSSKGPPPAHQHSDNPPSAHGSSTRELRRSSQSIRESSPPSFNLRSTRGKGSMANVHSLSQQKPVELIHGKNSMHSGQKRRGRPSSSASDSPPNVPGGDILDLSSLPIGGKSSSSRSDLRSRRYRDHEESGPNISTRSTSGTPTKASLKAVSKSTDEPEPEPEQAPEMRTTRARKRIGSRIDALALNLQAKRLNRSDSPNGDMSPPPSSAKDKSHELTAAHGQKSSGDSLISKAPPAAHSGAHKTGGSVSEPRTDKSSSRSSNSSAPSLPTPTPQANPRQDILSQLVSNPASLLAGLNPTTLGGTGELMNQLLRKPGTGDVVKNLMNEFIKNPSLALDPNVLATLTASLPLGNQGLPGFNLPNPSIPTSTNKTSGNSLLNDFKPPNNNVGKRPRHESTAGSSRTSLGQTSEGRRSTSSTPDRHDRKSSSSEKRGPQQDRSERSGKQEKRSSSINQVDSELQPKRSSSLLAQTSSGQTPQPSASPITSQSAIPSAASLNLASQFGGLNSLGNMLNFPGISELMKQMTNFPGSASLPRTAASAIPTSSAATTSSNPNTDKSLRRSRQSLQATPTSTTAQQNSALANSIMNLASQQSATGNPYGNFANPLANPFLPFGLGNIGLNNPLGMGLFPNLYMPPGFPGAEQQQSQASQNTSNSGDSGQKDKKLRFPRK